MHTLKGCEFAGWDSEEQFTVFTVKKSASQSPGQNCSKENCSQSSENQVKDSKEEPAHQRDVRKEEMEVEISPGERLSVVIACRAK